MEEGERPIALGNSEWVENPSQEPTPGCGCEIKQGKRERRCDAHGMFVKASTLPPELEVVQEADDAFVALRKLAELRDAGIVTPHEFDMKKAELLDRV